MKDTRKNTEEYFSFLKDALVEKNPQKFRRNSYQEIDDPVTLQIYAALLNRYNKDERNKNQVLTENQISIAESELVFSPLSVTLATACRILM